MKNELTTIVCKLRWHTSAPCMQVFFFRSKVSTCEIFDIFEVFIYSNILVYQHTCIIICCIFTKLSCMSKNQLHVTFNKLDATYLCQQCYIYVNIGEKMYLYINMQLIYVDICSLLCKHAINLFMLTCLR